jgi:hypothetical protein
MLPMQRQALFENTARSIGAAPREIQLRHNANCMKAIRATAGESRRYSGSKSDVTKETAGEPK